MRRRSRPSMRGSPISIGGSVAELDDRAEPFSGPGGAAMRAAEVVTFALVRSLAVPALAVPLVPARPQPRNASAGASRPKPWLLCGERAVATARSRNYPQAGPPPPPPPAARIATLLQKQFDTENPSTYISRTDGGGAVAASAASGLRDELEKGSSLLGSGAGRFGRLGLRPCRRIRVYVVACTGRLAPAVAAGIQREAKAFRRYLTIASERKRDVGGGVLAGLCCLGLFGASWQA